MSEAAAKKEEKPRRFQAIRGTRDLLPPETALWNRVEQTAHAVFGTFGFGEIRLPIFEETELFKRSVGAETDVGKEMWYTYQERIDIEQLANPHKKAFGLEGLKAALLEVRRHAETLTLRPEATASVCRAYIEHNMNQLPQPVKLYYMGPMFRRERPQKGRYRQFYQIGAEVLGGPDTPIIDAEVIEMVMTFFDRLQVEGVELSINSIGHSAPPIEGKNVCRRAYIEVLRAALEKVRDKLGPDSQRRIETNPLRVLDSKVESEQPIIEKLPRIVDYLCQACALHYAAVKHSLDMRGVKSRENSRLVRGLDYYMRTTFEITAKGLGSQNAVCGGGRYDGLVALLGGPPTKGVGFAIGEDRLILSLQESGESRSEPGSSVYIVWMGEAAHAEALSTASNLRSAGIRVELPGVEQKVGKALGQADKLGIKFAVILGENETSTGVYTVKTLSTGTQDPVRKSDLIDYLNQRFA